MGSKRDEMGEFKGGEGDDQNSKTELGRKMKFQNDPN